MCETTDCAKDHGLCSLTHLNSNLPLNWRCHLGYVSDSVFLNFLICQMELILPGGIIVRIRSDNVENAQHDAWCVLGSQ